MRRAVRALGASVFAGALFAGVAAFGQVPDDRATPLPAFGRSVASDEDTSAIVLNPANIALMPSWELRWQAAFLSEQAIVPWQGHAFSFATPIDFLNMGVGLRLDLIDPPSDNPAARFGNRSNYAWLTGALAYAPSPSVSLGASLQHSYSENPLLDSQSSWSLAYTWRPVNQLGIAVVGHDLNAPTNRAGGHVERSYDIGLALRPFGTRAAELGLEGKYVDAFDPYWIPRATLGVDIPDLGRLRGDFAIVNPDNGANRERSWLASVQMAFAFNQPGGAMELAAGTTFGNDLGREASGSVGSDIVTDVAFQGARGPTSAATEGMVYALRLRLEETPDARNHVALLRRLWQIADDEPHVAEVVLELRTAPADSFAHVQELRDALWYLRQRGKRVLCHLEDADGASLYLCSAASRILINPAGGLRFAGLKTRYFYLKGLLDKLGIRADFVRIGAHKSAPEMFTRDSSSDVARDDKIDLLQQFERHFVQGVAVGRKQDPKTLRERIAKGPFIASEAKAAGLVDGFAFDDEVEREAGKLVGYPIHLLDDSHRADRAPRTFGVGRRIGIVYVDGDMVDGRSQNIPVLGVRLVGSYTIADSIKQMREDHNVGAVVLRIETGGGSAMAADVIWREVALTAKEKPVIVSMGSAAASGGYYIATPATKVYANPLTITGSIGIFYGKADVSELLHKIGVNVEVFKTAPRADAESIFRPFTPDEHAELEVKVAQFYDMFLSRVAEGRHLTKSAVDAVGQGRVWTGEQALERKLVDEIGGLRQALEEARKLADLPLDAPIQELPVDSSFLGKLIGAAGAHASEKPPVLPAQIMEFARALAPFAVHPPDEPLALWEITTVE
ncbi:MAG TPA: signal peptide peptidase SppA [Polyangiaceae bacterium]|nr:signal peptide peptidase SppA [Polyangiaceae bacterium]